MFSRSIFHACTTLRVCCRLKYPDGKRGSSFQAHTPVRAGSDVLMLSVPVKKGQASIKDTQVSYGDDWAAKQLNQIGNFYRKCGRFDDVFPLLKTFLQGHQFSSLADLNIRTAIWALLVIYMPSQDANTLEQITESDINDALSKIQDLLTEREGVRTRQIVVASDLITKEFDDEQWSPTERIVALCRHYEATRYVAGGTAIESYLELSAFADANVAVDRQDWTCTNYSQAGADTDTFMPNLSVLDLIMNVDSSQARAVLEGVT